MGIVHLQGDVIRQRRPVDFSSPSQEARNDVLEGTAHHEILLQEPQRPAGFGRVVRIQHARDRFRGDVVDDRTGEVAMGELGEIERVRGRRGP